MKRASQPSRGPLLESAFRRKADVTIWEFHAAFGPKRIFLNCVAAEQHGKDPRPRKLIDGVVAAAPGLPRPFTIPAGENRAADTFEWQAKAFFSRGEAGRYNQGPRTGLGV